jgi:hypothetical protein
MGMGSLNLKFSRGIAMDGWLLGSIGLCWNSRLQLNM